MMNSYDPMVAPDPQAWLEIDEGERILLVEDYHRRKKIRMPNVHLHASFQCVVENQVAMGGDTPAADKLQELMREGLDRHEALHAIASVVARMFYGVMKHEIAGDANDWYNREVKKLTIKSWQETAGES